MILLLSGEGKTDMGQNVPSATGVHFQPGPMAWIVDRLLENHPAVNYSLLGVHELGGEPVLFVDEKEISQRGRPGPRLLRGIKYGKETALFTRNAQVLGLIAKEVQKEKNGAVVAVLFRDTDKTNAAPSNEWKEKFTSIKRGFGLVDFPQGVPMVPLPKSEAWLICALKEDPYQRCNCLEDAPGNDNSPNALKAVLERLVGRSPSAEEQVEWVKNGTVDPERIEMPSFMNFKAELQRAVDAATTAC